MNRRISAEKTLQELRVLFYCVAPIPLVGWFLAASAEIEGLAIFFFGTSPVLATCGVALLLRNWRRRNRDGRVWFLAFATIMAAAPVLLLILLLKRLPVGPLFP